MFEKILDKLQGRVALADGGTLIPKRGLVDGPGGYAGETINIQPVDKKLPGLFTAESGTGNKFYLAKLSSRNKESKGLKRRFPLTSQGKKDALQKLVEHKKKYPNLNKTDLYKGQKTIYKLQDGRLAYRTQGGRGPVKYYDPKKYGSENAAFEAAKKDVAKALKNKLESNIFSPTTAEKLDIKKSVLNGTPDTVIAEKYNVNVKTIKAFRDRENIKQPLSFINDEKIKTKFFKNYGKVTYGELAKQLFPNEKLSTGLSRINKLVEAYKDSSEFTTLRDQARTIQSKAASFFLKPQTDFSFKNFKKYVGVKNNGKALTLLKNTFENLGSVLTAKAGGELDTTRSIFDTKQFTNEQLKSIRQGIASVPEFQKVQFRHTEFLLKNAYSGKQLKTALDKLENYKKLRGFISKKFPGLQLVLDHPTGYTFLRDIENVKNPADLVRVVPIPDKVNTFKLGLDKGISQISQILRKNPGSKIALDRYGAIQEIARQLDLEIGKIGKDGKVISYGQSRFIAPKNLLPEIYKAPTIQNKFIDLINNYKNDPKTKALFERAGISLRRLKDYGSTSKVNAIEAVNYIKKLVKENPQFKKLVIPAAITTVGLGALPSTGETAEIKPIKKTVETETASTPEMASTPGMASTITPAAAIGASYVPKVRETFGKVLSKIPKPIRTVGGFVGKRVLPPALVASVAYDLGTKAQYETPGEYAATIAQQPLDFVGLGFLADKVKDNLRMRRYATKDELAQLDNPGMMDYYNETPSQTGLDSLKQELLARANRMEFGQAGEFRPGQVDVYQDTGDAPIYRIPEANKRFLKREQGLGSLEDIYGYGP